MRNLSPRQLQVVGLITDGFTNREIGMKLGIETRTVEVHRFNAYKRLRVRNVAQMMRVAMMKGLLPKPKRVVNG